MRVAIVGGAPSSEQAFRDCNDKNRWDAIWVLGNQVDRYATKPYHLVFEIHDDLSEHPPEYPEWLIKHSPKTIVSSAFPLSGEDILIYPKEEAKALLGGEFLSSSPAYMMAYAILKGADEIGLYGVDMAVNDHEYFKQRPGMYAWIGYAKGSGIKVTIADDSPLWKDAYDEGRDWGKPKSPFSEASIQEMMAIHQAKVDEHSRLVHTHSGCMQAYQSMAKAARAIESGQTLTSLSNQVEVK